MATYAIGDVHANISELRKLIVLLHLQKDDTVVFIGDLIDKGTETSETIAYLEELAKNHRVIFIKGNHEYVWERYLIANDAARQEFIMKYGGLHALAQFTDNPEGVVERNEFNKMKSWLEGYLRIVASSVDYHIEGDYLLLHAGLTPEQLNEQSIVFTEKNYFLRLKDMDTTKKYLGRYRVVSGHSHMGHEPFIDEGYINIDLGAGYDGFLGALHLEQGIVYRSDGAQYPISGNKTPAAP